MGSFSLREITLVYITLLNTKIAAFRLYGSLNPQTSTRSVCEARLARVVLRLVIGTEQGTPTHASDAINTPTNLPRAYAYNTESQHARTPIGMTGMLTPQLSTNARIRSPKMRRGDTFMLFRRQGASEAGARVPHVLIAR